jgi:hypothetical protein
VEARNAIYVNKIVRLVVVDLRGSSPSRRPIQATEISILLPDNVVLPQRDPLRVDLVEPGYFSETIQVEPRTVGTWGRFAFDAPDLGAAFRASKTIHGKVRVRNLDGRVLERRIEICELDVPPATFPFPISHPASHAGTNRRRTRGEQG